MREEERQLEWQAVGRRIVATFLAAFLVLTVVVSAVQFVSGSAAASSPRVSSGSRVLRIGVSGLTATTLNPNDITFVLEFIPVYNVYSTLATRDDRLNIVPDLASSWGVAPDQLNWTFHLVRNAYFTDPTNPTDTSHPVNADDVVFSYNMVKDNSSSVLWSYTSFLDTITKIDDYTVRIKTTAPFAGMNSTLTSIPIFPKYLWQGIADPVANEPHPYPVGSGAMYYDTNSDLSSHIILHRNPNYYGDAMYCQKSRPDEVRFLLYTASSTLIDDFGSGTSRLDAITISRRELRKRRVPESTDGHQDPSRGRVRRGSLVQCPHRRVASAVRRGGNTAFASGSNNQVLATNLVVRQAIAMSIDVPQSSDMRTRAWDGRRHARPGEQPWHYSIPPAQQYRFNTTAARQTLNNAGWTYDAAGNLAPGNTPLYKAGGTEPSSSDSTLRTITPSSNPPSPTSPSGSDRPGFRRRTRWVVRSRIRGQGPERDGQHLVRSRLRHLAMDWVFTRVSTRPSMSSRCRRTPRSEF